MKRKDDFTMALPFDVTARKSKGNARSAEAAERGHARRPSQRETVFEVVKAAGLSGATTNEIARGLGWSDNRVSARMSDLKVLGLIIPNGQTRLTANGDKADVFIAKELVTNAETNNTARSNDTP